MRPTASTRCRCHPTRGQRPPRQRLRAAPTQQAPRSLKRRLIIHPQLLPARSPAHPLTLPARPLHVRPSAGLLVALGPSLLGPSALPVRLPARPLVRSSPSQPSAPARPPTGAPARLLVARPTIGPRPSAYRRARSTARRPPDHRPPPVRLAAWPPGRLAACSSPPPCLPGHLAVRGPPEVASFDSTGRIAARMPSGRRAACSSPARASAPACLPVCLAIWPSARLLVAPSNRWPCPSARLPVDSDT